MSEQRQYPMTQEAFDNLRAELDQKLTVDKPAMAKRLKAAIEMGDLKENAEYISAKEDQAFLQGRIDELQELVRGATIIDESQGPSDTVRLGSHVTVQEKGESDTETFMLVGPVEASPVDGKISDESPLGKALFGKKVGDEVKVSAPDGDLVFKIKKIE